MVLSRQLLLEVCVMISCIFFFEIGFGQKSFIPATRAPFFPRSLYSCCTDYNWTLKFRSLFKDFFSSL